MKTKDFLRRGLLFATFSIIIFFLTTCGRDEITNNSISDNSLFPVYPALNDSIPYDLLGDGKVVFERKGPKPYGYLGVYVIDIKNHTAWLDSNAGSQNIINPTGNMIAFSEFTDIETHWDIYSVGLDGKNRNQITNLTMSGIFPSWSPDGSQIYFWGEWNNETLFYRMSAPPNISTPELIFSFSGFSPSGRLAISPEGDIAFVSHSSWNIALRGLYVLIKDGSKYNHYHLIVNETDSLKLESPIFSNDGQYIYFLRVSRPMLPNYMNGNYQSVDLMRINSDGNNSLLIATIPASGNFEWSDGENIHQENGVYLAKSPYGNQFLLNIPEGDYVSHLYCVNTDAKRVFQVTFADSVTDRCVSWGK